MAAPASSLDGPENEKAVGDTSAGEASAGDTSVNHGSLDHDSLGAGSADDHSAGDGSAGDCSVSDAPLEDSVPSATSSSSEPNWANSQSAASPPSRSSGITEAQIVQADCGVIGVAGGLDDLAGSRVAVNDYGDRGNLGTNLEQCLDGGQR